MVWHGEAELPDVGAVVLPGGFSYGDYLRCGAIARFSPAMQAVADFAAEGGLVLGVCNGFQILCEAGLLPGALRPNASLSFVCRDVTMRVERTDTLFTSRCEPGQDVTIPIKHGEGCFFADAELLDELEDQRTGRPPLRGEPERLGSRHRRRDQRGGQRHGPHASPRARGRSARRFDRRGAGPGLGRGRGPRAHGCFGLLKAQGFLQSGVLSERLASFSMSRARSVTGPRRAVPSVEYANRTSRSPEAALEELHDGREALLAGALLNSQLFEKGRLTPWCCCFRCHVGHASGATVTRWCRLRARSVTASS